MPARIGKVAIGILAVSCLGYWAWSPRMHASEQSSPKDQKSIQTTSGASGVFQFVSPPANGQWTEPAGDFGNARYSPLGQINTDTVKKLKVIATFSTGIPHGQEGQPLVINNAMYVNTPFPDNLLAINLNDPSGPLEWTFSPHPDPIAQGRACCDVVNRGAAYGDGKIVYQTLDDYTIAVNATTGKQVWRTKTGDVAQGETATGAPLIVKNRVYVGDSGDDFGVRGKLTCLDLLSGKILWTAYSEGPDSDVRIGPDFKPFYQKDQGANLGMKSWEQDEWRHGGGTVWGWISYDPDLNMIYYGTGEPGVWDPALRPGANKWSDTIFARDANTGYAKWAYQIEPHDNYGYGATNENILIDMKWNGRVRKLLLHPSRNGFLLVLDRESGRLLAAQKYEDSTNWASGYDLKTGLPIADPTKETHENVVTAGICPSTTGAKDFAPAAVSPKTGYLYLPAHNTCMNFEGLLANYISGTPFVGANVKMYAGPGGFQGELVAWDIQHAKPAWTIKDKLFPLYSGVLATAGNVVFYGTLEGWFRAVDARTGKILWQYKTASGIVGDPITYVGPDGKQYVAIYSGIGGTMGKVAQPNISADDPYGDFGATGAMAQIKKYSAPGGVLYIFGL